MGSVTTQKCDGTPFGDEELMRLLMSDDGLTDPSTGPSVEREVAEAANLDVPGQVAGNSAPEGQNASNQDQPARRRRFANLKSAGLVPWRCRCDAS